MTRGNDASNSGKATGNNQPAQQKDKRGAQHKCQHNDSNVAVTAMVTAIAAATMGTTMAAMATKTMVATAMVEGIDNN